jgi:Kef-type K+ transport system membrane component KefB
MIKMKTTLVILAAIAAFYSLYSYGRSGAQEVAPDSVYGPLPADTTGQYTTEETADQSGEVQVETEEPEQVGPILFSLIVILLAAKLGGDLVERFKQPAVLGELIFGMIIGNLALAGIFFLEPLKHHITIEILAEIGVILLLFEVGLESSLEEMLSVGMTSFFVALIGVVVPFLLGWGVSAMFFPEESIFIHIFVGATLTATSVGITARVLKDIGRIRTREAKIILGAAVIDDIMGLVVLAVVVGVIGAHNTGGSLSSLKILWIVVKAFLFIFGALVIGTALAPYLFRMASKLRAQSILITFSLMFCFTFALAADRIGLAPIVGAFAAGMILSGVNFEDIFLHEKRQLEDLLHPISAFLVPVFFVYMGMNVDLSTFTRFQVIFFALALTLAAILGKQICSLSGFFEKKINFWVIGVGMIPRGEVGLIFAGIGAKLFIDGERVVSPDAYSAVIIMVMITTLVTPPVLKLVFHEKD